jgi:N-hydroxyarylamine O-acetyltransferase
MGDVVIDLDEYFGRIGYDGPRTVGLETLRGLSLTHPTAIAFENLDPLMGRRVHLDEGALYDKLIVQGRGGYCYEHNLLFADVLKALGFAVTGLAARVVKNVPEGSVRPRTHMLLRVDLEDGVYLADVGFGMSTLTAPMRFEMGVEQETPHDSYRLAEAGVALEMQVKVGDDWSGLYRFDLQEQFRPDYEVTNWYSSCHPDSQFVAELMVARADEGCHHTLLDNVYTLRVPDGPPARRTIENADDLRAVLTDIFRINLPDDPALDAVLTRIAGE